ncbi:hypothetical protein [Streptomyces sp. NRRL S-337]|uniref:hypothetical protein n=1 Tax=Streptomyces sp. NRRL S-337 TaxID=1463900 RepID=UPI00131C524D|nr:hypothetical protein [Streptomyces sp. NRRL S-337]
MRKKLETQGYKVSGYREDRTKKPWALMDAKGGEDNLFVSAQRYMPSTHLVFSVNTPCFRTPGVKQQQESAPPPNTTAPAHVLPAEPAGTTSRFAALLLLGAAVGASSALEMPSCFS